VKSPPPGTPDGGVTTAVRLALIDIGLDSVARAEAAMAVALARLVDAGSVPAARELRPLLADLSLIEDEVMREFLASVRTPMVREGGHPSQ
jgi:hypothetical protein